MSNKMRFALTAIVRILVLFGLTVTMLPMPLVTGTSRLVLAQEPGEQQIAYVGKDGNLWLMNSDGSNKTQLTHISEGRIVGYDWSPNGRRLVFVRTMGDGNKQPTDIYLLDLENGDQSPLLPDASYYYYGGIAWSPLGDQIAFTTGSVSVELINVDTKNSVEVFRQTVLGMGVVVPPKMNAVNWSPDGNYLAVDMHIICSAVLSLGKDPTAELQYCFPDRDRSRSDPRLSPNGQVIAWMDWENDEDEALVITDLAGETLTWISGDTCVDPGHNTASSWSPDGQRMAMGGPGGLCVVNIETGARQALVSERGVWNPSWSTDGALIVFSYLESLDMGVEEQGIGVASADGRGVTDLGVYGSKPSWRPGTSNHSTVSSSELQGQMAYVDINGNIWVRDLASEAKTQLTFEGRYAEPAWSPDGTRIAFVHFTGTSDQDVPITEVGVVQIDGLQQRILVEPQRDPLAGVYPYLRNPRWSPDGRFLFYQENTGGPARNYIRKIDVSNIRLDQHLNNRIIRH